MNHEAAMRLVRECCETAQRLIDALHERDPQSETFSQVGFLDGQTTVSEYLAHNELGVALEHLLYMIHESDIAFQHDRIERLHALARDLGIENHYAASTIAKPGDTAQVD